MWNSVSERGQSLITVLIAVGLLGVVAAGTTALIQQIMVMQNTNKYLSTQINFDDEIRAVLSSKAACLNTFGAVTLDSTTNQSFSQIKNDDGSVFATLNVPTNNNPLSIQSMTLKNYKDTTSPDGQVELHLVYQSQSKVYGSSELVSTILLATEKNASSQLTNCISEAKMTDGIWRYNPTVLTSIFYNGGNVGVGTTTPATKLDVNGEVKVGSSGLACTAAIAGAVRYSAGKMQYCNGALAPPQWSDFGGQDMSKCFVCIQAQNYSRTQGWSDRGSDCVPFNGNWSSWVMPGDPDGTGWIKGEVRVRAYCNP